MGNMFFFSAGRQTDCRRNALQK